MTRRTEKRINSPLLCLDENWMLGEHPAAKFSTTVSGKKRTVSMVFFEMKICFSSLTPRSAGRRLRFLLYLQVPTWAASVWFFRAVCGQLFLHSSE